MLSSGQQGLPLDPRERLYVDQVVYRLGGDPDERALEAAWAEAAARHPTLRTSLRREGADELVQVVHRRCAVPIERHDLRDPSGDPEERLEHFLQADRARGFALERPPLLRISLVRTDETGQALVFRYHHLLMDAWSALMLLRETFERYGAHLAGDPEPLLSPRPYDHYAAWLRAQDVDGAERHWRGRLDGFREPVRLPLTAAGGGADAAAGRESAERRLDFEEEATARLRELARDHGVTLSTVIQSAWAALLGRYGDCDDVVFGLTVSNRPAELEGIQDTVGLFANTVPVRMRLVSDEPFMELCARVHRAGAEDRPWQFAPLEQVRDWSDLPAGAPLFDSLVTVLDVPSNEGALALRDQQYRYRPSYPLSLMVLPAARLSVRAGYDAGSTSGASVERILGHLERVLRAVAHNPMTAVDAIALADPPAPTGIASRGEAPPNFAALVADTIARRGTAPALVAEERTITYAELGVEIDRLAVRLRAAGTGRGSIVGVCLERSPELLIAELAALRIGAAFVPLDPSYPDDRLHFMLRDARPAIVITDRTRAARVAGAPLLLIEEAADWPLAVPDVSPAEAAGPGELAYVIYTSGSTGRPKGAILAHRGLVNVALAQLEVFRVTAEDRVLQWASPSFDVAVFDLTMAIGPGAQLHVATREQLLPGEPLDVLLRERRITVMTSTPSALAACDAHGAEDLRLLACTGERLPGELAERWLDGGRRRVVNTYGPTEATIWATAHEVQVGEGDPPIGRPVGGVATSIRDRRGRVLPRGAVGELVLGGVGVGLGYLNRPQLTAERFVADEAGEGRLYRTGDLVVEREDESIEFRGRVDRQIKLRGVRLELGEIEAGLMAAPEVEAAAVVVADAATPEARLLAFALVADGVAPAGEALRERLARELPEQAVPAAVIAVRELPITPAGKLDEAALLALAERPDPGRHSKRRSSSPTEAALAEIWGEVLRRPSVAPDEDFFALGGNSISATLIASRVRQRLGAELSLPTIFGRRTVAACAAVLDGDRDEVAV